MTNDAYVTLNTVTKHQPNGGKWNDIFCEKNQVCQFRSVSFWKEKKKIETVD